MKKITDDIYILPFVDEYDWPNVGYIKGLKKSMLVDFGCSKKHISLMLDFIEKNNLISPTYGVLTHHHWDHSFGLPYLDIVSIASSKENKRLEKLKSLDYSNLDDCIDDSLIPEFCREHIEISYSDTNQIVVESADIVVDGKLEIDLGDKHALVYNVENSHTDDCLIVFIREDHVLFTGDAEYGEIHGMDFIIDSTRLNAFIDFIASLDFSQVINGHGEPMSKNDYLDLLNEALQGK